MTSHEMYSVKLLTAEIATAVSLSGGPTAAAAGQSGGWSLDDVTVTVGPPTYIGKNVAGIEGGGIYWPAGTLVGYLENVMRNNPDNLAPPLP